MYNRTRTTREKSPWAVIFILVVVILFGMYWLRQRQQINFSTNQIPAAKPVTHVSKPVTPSISDLEANAANIAIPSFEKIL